MITVGATYFFRHIAVELANSVRNSSLKFSSSLHTMMGLFTDSEVWQVALISGVYRSLKFTGTGIILPCQVQYYIVKPDNRLTSRCRTEAKK
jgi:hypothetical protein